MRLCGKAASVPHSFTYVVCQSSYSKWDWDDSHRGLGWSYFYCLDTYTSWYELKSQTCRIKNFTILRDYRITIRRYQILVWNCIQLPGLKSFFYISCENHFFTRLQRPLPCTCPHLDLIISKRGCCSSSSQPPYAPFCSKVQLPSGPDG